MKIKYPPVLSDEETRTLGTIGARIPNKYRTILADLGHGSMSMGVYVLIYSMENEILKFLEKRNNKKGDKTSKVIKP